ncbi:MAG TPA: hypothetical protein VEB86_01035 [Chryseosolibacter sp.]|nr:hypothetical protein [Chryseosolibacter sp.]
MKWFLLTFFLSGFSQVLMAQEYKQFRVLIGTGFATGSGYTSLGIFGTLEPAYRVSDRILTGFRTEIAGIARGGLEGFKVDVDVSRVSSTTVNGVYYFGNDFVRPFAGFGAGYYWLSAIEYSLAAGGPEESTGKDRKFGIYPRLGVEFGHLSLSIDYNIVPKTETSEGAEFRNSYLAFRLGVFFGGGRIKGQ